MASDTASKKLEGEEDVDITDGYVSISMGYDATSAPVATVLSVIQRDAPEAFAQWIDANLSDRYEDGYNAGHKEGYLRGRRDGRIYVFPDENRSVAAPYPEYTVVNPNCPR